MKALLLLMVSGVLAAGVFITGKQAGGEQLSPLLILFWQMSGGAVVVWAVSWPSRQFPSWSRAHVRYYFLGGLLGVSIPYMLAFVVLQELQVGIVGLLTALSPIVTYGMARLLGQEKGHTWRLLGLIIGLAGVALLLSPQNPIAHSGNGHYLLLALGIPVSLAASNIYRSRYWPPASRAMPLVTGMLTVQALILWLINLVLGNFQDITTDVPSHAPVLVVLGVTAGASYLTSFNLLRLGGPVYLSQMGYVITATTMLAGIVLWGERYDGRDLMSMGLIFAGVLLTTVAQKIRKPDQSAPIEASR